MELITFENTYRQDRNSLKSTDPDAFGCITIDGFPESEDGDGMAVCEVWMTVHEDIIVSWHHNGYRMCQPVLDLVEDAKAQLRDMWDKDHSLGTPAPIDFSALAAGMPVWRVRSTYIRNDPGQVISDTVRCVDAANRQVTTDGLAAGTIPFRMDDPKNGYLYATEPNSFITWLLFQNRQDAQDYLDYQTLLQNVWAKVTNHAALRKCSTAQLNEILRVLDNPDG